MLWSLPKAEPNWREGGGGHDRSKFLRVSQFDALVANCQTSHVTAVVFLSEEQIYTGCGAAW